MLVQLGRNQSKHNLSQVQSPLELTVELRLDFTPLPLNLTHCAESFCNLWKCQFATISCIQKSEWNKNQHRQCNKWLLIIITKTYLFTISQNNKGYPINCCGKHRRLDLFWPKDIWKSEWFTSLFWWFLYFRISKTLMKLNFK